MCIGCCSPSTQPESASLPVKTKSTNLNLNLTRSMTTCRVFGVLVEPATAGHVIVFSANHSTRRRPCATLPFSSGRHLRHFPSCCQKNSLTNDPFMQAWPIHSQIYGLNVWLLQATKPRHIFQVSRSFLFVLNHFCYQENVRFRSHSALRIRACPAQATECCEHDDM